MSLSAGIAIAQVALQIYEMNQTVKPGENPLNSIVQMLTVINDKLDFIQKNIISIMQQLEGIPDKVAFQTIVKKSYSVVSEHQQYLQKLEVYKNNHNNKGESLFKKENIIQMQLEVGKLNDCENTLRQLNDPLSASLVAALLQCRLNYSRWLDTRAEDELIELQEYYSYLYNEINSLKKQMAISRSLKKKYMAADYYYYHYREKKIGGINTPQRKFFKLKALYSKAKMSIPEAEIFNKLIALGYIDPLKDYKISGNYTNRIPISKFKNSSMTKQPSEVNTSVWGTPEKTSGGKAKKKNFMKNRKEQKKKNRQSNLNIAFYGLINQAAALQACYLALRNTQRRISELK